MVRSKFHLQPRPRGKQQETFALSDYRYNCRHPKICLSWAEKAAMLGGPLYLQLIAVVVVVAVATAAAATALVKWEPASRLQSFSLPLSLSPDP